MKLIENARLLKAENSKLNKQEIAKQIETVLSQEFENSIVDQSLEELYSPEIN